MMMIMCCYHFSFLFFSPSLRCETGAPQHNPVGPSVPDYLGRSLPLRLEHRSTDRRRGSKMNFMASCDEVKNIEPRFCAHKLPSWEVMTRSIIHNRSEYGNESRWTRERV